MLYKWKHQINQGSYDGLILRVNPFVDTNGATNKEATFLIQSESTFGFQTPMEITPKIASIDSRQTRINHFPLTQLWML